MKKNLLLSALIFSLLACNKKSEPNPQSGLLDLTNTTWRGYITQEQNDSLFQFVQFSGKTQATATIGRSLTDEEKSAGTYPCEIKIDPKNSQAELFLITYPTKIDTGSTLQYTKYIVYHGFIMSKYDN